MQSVSSKIWTRVAVSISYDDNDYTIFDHRFHCSPSCFWPAIVFIDPVLPSDPMRPFSAYVSVPTVQLSDIPTPIRPMPFVRFAPYFRSRWFTQAQLFVWPSRQNRQRNISQTIWCSSKMQKIKFLTLAASYNASTRVYIYIYIYTRMYIIVPDRQNYPETQWTGE